jgi:hypothetical protein
MRDVPLAGAPTTTPPRRHGQGRKTAQNRRNPPRGAQRTSLNAEVCRDGAHPCDRGARWPRHPRARPCMRKRRPSGRLSAGCTSFRAAPAGRSQMLGTCASVDVRGVSRTLVPLLRHGHVLVQRLHEDARPSRARRTLAPRVLSTACRRPRATAGGPVRSSPAQVVGACRPVDVGRIRHRVGRVRLRSARHKAANEPCNRRHGAGAASPAPSSGPAIRSRAALARCR